MSVLRHSAWLMTNLCRPKPQEEALLVFFFFPVYVCAAPLFVADDQSVSPKASGGGTDGVCSFFSVYVCAAPLCVADDQSVSPKASGGGTHGVCV